MDHVQLKEIIIIVVAAIVASILASGVGSGSAFLAVVIIVGGRVSGSAVGGLFLRGANNCFVGCFFA